MANNSEMLFDILPRFYEMMLKAKANLYEEAMGQAIQSLRIAEDGVSDEALDVFGALVRYDDIKRFLSPEVQRVYALSEYSGLATVLCMHFSERSAKLRNDPPVRWVILDQWEKSVSFLAGYYQADLSGSGRPFRDHLESYCDDVLYGCANAGSFSAELVQMEERGVGRQLARHIRAQWPILAADLGLSLRIPAKEPCDLAGLRNAPKLAWLSYQVAEKHLGDPTDDEAYYFLLNHSPHVEIPEGFNLPILKTWKRALREARKKLGASKNTPRQARELGSSVVPVDRI